MNYDELKQLLKTDSIFLCDVRETKEVEEGKIPQSVHIPRKCHTVTNCPLCTLYPLSDILALTHMHDVLCSFLGRFFPVIVGELASALEMSPTQFSSLYKQTKPDDDDLIVFHCHLGVRSAMAIHIATDAGFTRYVVNFFFERTFLTQLWSRN